MRKAGYVALVGRPNVGKSTLLNQLIGQKLAITSHKAQTTRHRILGVDTSDKGQVIYVDTPGIHQRGEKAMNRYLNKAAQSALADVDVIAFVVQAGVWNEEDKRVLSSIRNSHRPAVIVVNKIDTLKAREALLPYLSKLMEETGMDTIIPVSAKSGENCETLADNFFGLLPEGENIYPEDQLTDRSSRFIAAELIREQIIHRYHNELPYSTTIEIEQFQEKPNIYHIAAVVWVERDNQKAIIVGKQGQRLKETAIAARKELEAFFGIKVNLKIWVKVKKSWSSDAKTLSQLGYDS